MLNLQQAWKLRRREYAWRRISALLSPPPLLLEDCEGVGGSMLLLTVVLSLQLAHSVDTNAYLPLAGNHIRAQIARHREKEQRTWCFWVKKKKLQNTHTCGKISVSQFAEAQPVFWGAAKNSENKPLIFFFVKFWTFYNVLWHTSSHLASISVDCNGLTG